MLHLRLPRAPQTYVFSVEPPDKGLVIEALAIVECFECRNIFFDAAVVDTRRAVAVSTWLQSTLRSIRKGRFEVIRLPRWTRNVTICGKD